MGVCTTAYSIPPKMMRKIRANNDNLGYVFDYIEDEDGIFGAGEDKSKIWEVESYDFDTVIETYITIFRESGYKKTARNIDSEYADLDAFDYGGYDIWAIPPSGVKVMCKELENVTFEVLKTKELSEVTDRRGNTLLDSELESYLSDIDGIKKFFDKAFEHRNYLIFAEM
jgi:hypothetical protein